MRLCLSCVSVLVLMSSILLFSHLLYFFCVALLARSTALAISTLDRLKSAPPPLNVQVRETVRYLDTLFSNPVPSAVVPQVTGQELSWTEAADCFVAPSMEEASVEVVVDEEGTVEKRSLTPDDTPRGLKSTLQCVLWTTKQPESPDVQLVVFRPSEAPVPATADSTLSNPHTVDYAALASGDPIALWSARFSVRIKTVGPSDVSSAREEAKRLAEERKAREANKTVAVGGGGLGDASRQKK